MARKWTEKIKTLKKYDTTAASYDAQYMKEQQDKFEVALNPIKLSSKSVVLDAGCGTGLLMERVAGNAGLVVGVDFSEGMLARARGRLDSFQNVSTIRADADFLPFREDAFTHVLAVTLLQNVSNPTVTLKELSRVTRNGAFMVVTGLKKNFTLKSLRRALNEVGVEQLATQGESYLRDYVVICRKARSR